MKIKSKFYIINILLRFKTYMTPLGRTNSIWVRFKKSFNPTQSRTPLVDGMLYIYIYKLT